MEERPQMEGVMMNQLNQEIAAIRNQISMYDTILNFEDITVEYRRELESKKEKLENELNLRLDELKGV